MLLTRPWGASGAPCLPQGSRCCLPPVPSGASAPGSRERLALPAGQGVPLLTPAPQEIYPQPSSESPGHSCFPGPSWALHTPSRAPKKLPLLTKQGLQWRWRVTLAPGGRIHSFPQQGLKLFNCWNEKVSHETQHPALPTKGMETLQPSRPQWESKAGVFPA